MHECCVSYIFIIYIYKYIYIYIYIYIYMYSTKALYMPDDKDDML